MIGHILFSTPSLGRRTKRKDGERKFSHFEEEEHDREVSLYVVYGMKLVYGNFTEGRHLRLEIATGANLIQRNMSMSMEKSTTRNPKPESW